MYSNIKMKTNCNTEKVCLADGPDVLRNSCGDQPQIQLGASTSKHTDNSTSLILNTSLHLNVKHHFNEHSDYSSESEDTEGSFDDEKNEKLSRHANYCNSGTRTVVKNLPIQEDINSLDLNQNCEQILSDIRHTCFDSSKNTEARYGERNTKCNTEIGTIHNDNRKVFKYTSHGLSQNGETFFSDVRHCNDTEGYLSDSFEDRSHEDNVRERMRIMAVHKILIANNKLILSLSTLENCLTVQLAKVRKKLSCMKTVRWMFLCDSDKVSHRVQKTYNTGLQSCFTYFQDTADKSVCPQNEDSLTKVTHSELVMGDFAAFSTWSNGDKIQLKRAIQRVIRMRKLQSEVQTMKSVCSFSRNEIKVLETDTIEEQEWEDVSREVQGKHSAAECRSMWINHIEPSLNCKPFTEKVKARLKEIVEHYHRQDWDAIAAALNTGHSALQCYILYMNTCTKDKRHLWSGEESQRLQRQCIKNQIGKTVDWKRVIFHMQKPGKYVRDHWMFVANPNIKKGKFTRKENAQMIKGIRIFGTNFTKISHYFLPSRTSKQLHCHYKQLMSSTVMGKWSKLEDMHLLHHVETYERPNWTEISKYFIDPVRTRSQVRGRYLTLKRWMSNNLPLNKLHTRSHMKRMQEKGSILTLAKNDHSLEVSSRLSCGRKLKKELKIDSNIKTFLHVNFVENRTEWSLEKSFILSPEEVEKRVYDIKRLLPLLNVNVNINSVKLVSVVSISNHDKMVFRQLQKEICDDDVLGPLNCPLPHGISSPDPPLVEFEDTDTQMTHPLEETVLNSKLTVLSQSGSGPNSVASTTDVQQSCISLNACNNDSTGTVDNTYGECSYSTSSVGQQVHVAIPSSPYEEDETSSTEHNDFLVPSVSILDALIDILLDERVYGHAFDPNLESDDGLQGYKCNESFIEADNLFMERLKTMFLCPLLLTTKDVALAESIIDAGSTTSASNLIPNEEKACKSDVNPQQKKRGRPCKRKKRVASKEEVPIQQPKRKYVRTGNFSKANNLTPRVSLRTSCKKNENTLEPQKLSD